MAGALHEDGEQVEGLVGERDANVVAPQLLPVRSSLKGAKYFTFCEENCDRNGARGHGWSDSGTKSYRNPTAATTSGNPTGLLP